MDAFVYYAQKSENALRVVNEHKRGDVFCVAVLQDTLGPV
jgi:hypothetical protein